MPLTPIQQKVVSLLSQNIHEESYLAGGAALHIEPNSNRYSEDLDYFHDTEKRVAEAFEADSILLSQNGFDLSIELEQPGYIKAIVTEDSESCKVEWAHDSSWRFLPLEEIKGVGKVLSPIDLSINKLLALVGRDEPRDFIDTLHTHENILPLGAQIWAACGKDEGYSPGLLLELLKRRGKLRQEDVDRLHLAQKLNVKELKSTWLSALSDAEDFIEKAPPESIGALFFDGKAKSFIQPSLPLGKFIKLHYGRAGGVIPRVLE